MQKCYVQSSDQPALPFTDHLEERKNGDFIVAEFDRRETRPGHEEFIWLCIKRGRRYSLVDIPFQTNGQITRLQDIRKQYNWWKRYSLYSAIGVKEVMASIPGFDKTQQRIPAVVTDLNIIEYTSRLEKAKRNLLEKCIDHEDCGTDIKGHHHSDKEICVDYSWDIMFNDEYRKMKYLDDLDDMDLRSAYLRRMTSMLEYFWRNGIDEVGMRFLHAEGFVTSYDGLIYDKWFDAAHPYGRTIRALLVVEGWNIMRLLQLIGVGAFLIVSIVSIITETFHSPEVGLTAGTYTVSLLAILLTMFIFMSAII